MRRHDQLNNLFVKRLHFSVIPLKILTKIIRFVSDNLTKKKLADTPLGWEESMIVRSEKKNIKDARKVHFCVFHSNFQENSRLQ